MVIKAIEIKNQRHILGQLTKLTSRLSNLTPLFGNLASDFYIIERNVIFQGRPGKFPDLKQTTKDQKRRLFHSEYPVLVGSGRLRQSLTAPGARDNITRIGKLTATLGTKTPYANFLQFGTRNMDKRPPIIPELYEKRWTRSTEAFLKKVMRKF